jgi:hypothetical protein
MLAGAILGLAAGASAGAIDGVRRERRYDRFATADGISHDNAAAHVVHNGQVVGVHHGNTLYNYNTYVAASARVCECVCVCV